MHRGEMDSRDCFVVPSSIFIGSDNLRRGHIEDIC